MAETTISNKPEKSGFGAGDLYLLASSFAWGVNFPIAKSVLAEMDPMIFSASRYFVASLFLFAILFVRRENLKVSLREFLMLSFIGILGITIFQGAWALGLNLTSASKASVLVATAPIFGAMIGSFRGDKTSILGWVGIAVSILGVFILVNNSVTELTFAKGNILGDLLIIVAAIIWSVYTIVSASMVKSRGPIVVTSYGMLVGAVVLSFAAFPALPEQNWDLPLSIWISWGSTAFLGAAFAFVWYCAGISRLGVSRGMVYGFFIPAVAIATAILFFDETMSVIQISGAVLILFGVYLTRRS
ncbi:MAG: DMT family transporter [Sneathiellales bacterium]|nr:DMT family transporter [Sneathiellales bacterium]